MGLEFDWIYEGLDDVFWLCKGIDYRVEFGCVGGGIVGCGLLDCLIGKKIGVVLDCLYWIVNFFWFFLWRGYVCSDLYWLFCLFDEGFLRYSVWVEG